MMKYDRRKIQRLKKILREMKSVVVAFSGGLDSAFLLKTALDTLGRQNTLAAIAKSDSFPKREYKSAKKLAGKLAAPSVTVYTKEGKDKNFIKNPADRCYYCKKELFMTLASIAKKRGFDFVIDGFNHDDRRDYRYGAIAARELGIRSPLAEARLGKEDIRKFSRELKLPTWNKPSFACLASRIPYYDKITANKLKKIERAEEVLYGFGFRQVRVRAHGNIARIELSDDDITMVLADSKLRKNLAKRLKQLGFLYVTIDLVGYRTGSMNEVLKKPARGLVI